MQKMRDLGVGAACLSFAWFMFNVSFTWSDDNTNDLSEGGKIGLIVAIVMLLVIGVIGLSVWVAIRFRGSRQEQYDDYGMPPQRGSRQFDAHAPTINQRALSDQQQGGYPGQGQPIYAYGQHPGMAQPQMQQYGYGGVPMPPPEGQFARQGVQYDLGSGGW